jgi:hypothetical protein
MAWIVGNAFMYLANTEAKVAYRPACCFQLH